MNDALLIILSIISIGVIYYVLFGYKNIRKMGGLTIILGLFIVSGCNGNLDAKKVSQCNIDSDCVPATVCHASDCVPREQGPNREDVFCTMECAPGTMDCGQGECGCVNNRCEAVWI